MAQPHWDPYPFMEVVGPLPRSEVLALPSGCAPGLAVMLLPPPAFLLSSQCPSLCPTAHKGLLQRHMVPALWAWAAPWAPHPPLLSDRLHLCPGRAGGLLAGGDAGGTLWQVRGWHGADGAVGAAPLLCVPHRHGTLGRSALLVLLAGGLMAFSQQLAAPEMVIIGRAITGLHSGGWRRP